MYQQEIPIFFAVDDAYIPFLAVTIQSIFENKSEKNLYKIKILYTKITDENKKEILKYSKENINIEFVNVEENLKKLKDKLLVRDYYSDATYYRILIPNMFQEYDKILYLDADIVVLDDIANLYNINLENNLVGGAPEPWFKEYEEFQVYAEKVIEVQNYKEYINVGVLLMNLKELRKMDFENVFINLLDTKKFTLLQDEDYINKICNGRIKYIDEKWNVSGYLYDNSDPKIVHYTIFKPWLKKEMLNKDYFWNYARKTAFYEYISSLMSEETEEKGDISLREFRKMAISEVKNLDN